MEIHVNSQLALTLCKSSEQRTAHDSHTNHCHLADGELIQRLHDVQKASWRSLDRMRAKLNRLIDRDGIELNTRDSIDTQDNHMCKGIACEVRSRFGECSFRRVLWEQLDYHTHAKKQGMI